MFCVRINKLKVFNNREGFPELFPNQRSVYDPVNDNDTSVNRVNDGETFVLDMPGIMAVSKHVPVGGYGENTCMVLKCGDLAIYPAQEVFGGNGCKQFMFNIVNHMFDILFCSFREMYKINHTLSGYNDIFNPSHSNDP